MRCEGFNVGPLIGKTSRSQLSAGQNRIIIERLQDDIIYIHMIAHTSRNLEALIRRRLFSTD